MREALPALPSQCSCLLGWLRFPAEEIKQLQNWSYLPMAMCRSLPLHSYFARRPPKTTTELQIKTGQENSHKFRNSSDSSGVCKVIARSEAMRSVLTDYCTCAVM